MVKNLPASAGDMRDKGSIPGLGRFPGGGHGSPLQCSCLENSMDRGAWVATDHGVSKSRHDWACARKHDMQADMMPTGSQQRCSEPWTESGPGRRKSHHPQGCCWSFPPACLLHFPPRSLVGKLQGGEKGHL